MIKIGLASISFRKLDADTIISACRKAGIDAIEWGGDIHVPHGDIKTAGQIKKKTLSSGIEISSYGSYYRVGISENEGLSFENVLNSAKALGAPIIRVWAYNKNFEECSKDEIDQIVKDTMRIADMAQKDEINISFEYHCNTLTNSNENAEKFASMTEHNNIRFYWQPPNGKNSLYCKAGLQMLLFRKLLTNVHIFHWTFKQDIIKRHLLCKGINVWAVYLNEIINDNCDRYIIFEFFKDDNINNFYKDVITLKKLLSPRQSIKSNNLTDTKIYLPAADY